jgi:hypothetical protein
MKIMHERMAIGGKTNTPAILEVGGQKMQQNKITTRLQRVLDENNLLFQRG